MPAWTEEFLLTGDVIAGYCDTSCNIYNENRVWAIGVFTHPNGEALKIAVAVVWDGPGEYDLTLDNFGRVSGKTASGEALFKATSFDNTGSVTITAFDMEQRMVAGRFSFRADTPGNPFAGPNTLEPKPVTVADGEFRARFEVNPPEHSRAPMGALPLVRGGR